MGLTVLGLIVLALTALDYSRRETNTAFILDNWSSWFEISAAKLPWLYWTIIAIQTVTGITLVILGVVQ